MNLSVYLFLSLLPHTHSTPALLSFHHPSSPHDPEETNIVYLTKIEMLHRNEIALFYIEIFILSIKV
jgi:hypothetical protein